MNWTRSHGPILADAFGKILGQPEVGDMAFVRCLGPDIIDALARDLDGFAISGWTILRVADAEDAKARTISADRAVEIREGKGSAVLLLVDTARAGAGMDGIYSATREVAEEELFGHAHRLAAGRITKTLGAGHRKYSEKAVAKARDRGRFALSPWEVFDFYCHVATNNRPAGEHLHLIGLWPVEGEGGPDALRDIDESRRFVDRLLIPAVAGWSPARRIDGLRVLDPTERQRTDLEKFLRKVGTLPFRESLPRLVKRRHLWVNALRTESATDEILDVELDRWRTKTGKIAKWSGLTDRRNEMPIWIVDPEAKAGKYSKLEVRWKARPDHLGKRAVEYRVVVSTSIGNDELASWEGPHSAKAKERCVFTVDDLPELSETSAIPARVVLSVVGSDSIHAESEEFELVYGEAPDDAATAAGKRFRAFSDALVDLRSRDEVTRMASFASTQPKNAKGDWLVWHAPSVRRNFRVYRPPLIREAEQAWNLANNEIGRWRVKVRMSGERVGMPEFVPLERPEGVAPVVWNRAQKASRKIAERSGDFGAVGEVYDERDQASKNIVAEYLRAWIALLGIGEPSLALANTIEVQSQSGDVIGIVVCPGHPLRMAWHAAYDNLVLHAKFEEDRKPADVRKEMKVLDGAAFPAFLPGLEPGRSFVFADTLGFHAVGMVRDDDPEPKGTLAILHRALTTRDAAGGGARPTVGSRSAEVLAGELAKYLSSHEAVGVMHVHGLRAGDGRTVVQALGRAAEEARKRQRSARVPPDVSSREVFGLGERHADELVFVLELHPSQLQQRRGIAGRFISEALEKRRRGAGTIAETDRWMLGSANRPGGVRLPNLRWARKESPRPESAAHVALAFDTFASRVSATEKRSEKRPVYAFGLMSFLERRYQRRPHPKWEGVVPEWSSGEGHPAGRAYTARLRDLQRLLNVLVARNIGSKNHNVPLLLTEVSPEAAEDLDRLHTLCDWVMTLDRNAGIEYFDSPRADPETYDKFVIDCVPEREDLGCLQLITSTSNLDEVRSLLDIALGQMGLSNSPRNAEFLMEHLKALSGRLAIRLTGGSSPASELVALSICHANCRAAVCDEEVWVSLKNGFLVPVDDVRELLPPVATVESNRVRGTRPDLIHVTQAPRGGLAFRFIEIKYRRRLRDARSPKVLEGIRGQTTSLADRWFAWYGAGAASKSFLAVRRAKLARVLRFYADKGRRHSMPDDAYRALVGEIDRMVGRGSAYPLSSALGGERGWVFCPEYPGSKPVMISPEEWRETKIFLFGPASLPDLDWRPDDRLAADTLGPETPSPRGFRATTVENVEFPTDEAVKTVKTEPDPGAPSDDEGPTGNRLKAGSSVEPSITLGLDRFASEDVCWPLTVKGNPHLLVAGLSGMGKTTCLLNICKQMMAGGIRPIVFSYHQDIDEKLEAIGEPVRFVDFDGLGFNPLAVLDRSSKFAHLDVAGMIRDIFLAIFPELGALQGADIRKAVKESFEEAGWSGSTGGMTDLEEPPFRRFLEILRSRHRPNVGLRNLLERLDELDDYGFFDLNESLGGMWDSDRPTVIRIHRTQSDVLQRAFSSLIFYGLYKNMFRRGIQDQITHAVIMDEAHRASRLKLIPTMAKECRKYGVSLVLASQEAKDFHPSVFSAIANYLVLRLNEADAKALVKNVSSSRQQGMLLDRIKQMERFKGLHFSANRARPSHIDLPDFSAG